MTYVYTIKNNEPIRGDAILNKPFYILLLLLEVK